MSPAAYPIGEFATVGLHLLAPSLSMAYGPVGGTISDLPLRVPVHKPAILN
jgi:hypothetical protein